ncbi:hypothetical protein C9374_004446 [Naegleria lovaniensis]|uniref:Uncharacterized protein n=1 Tax=Naegleria lovaniensis TaxID=51637 RepID=A0AA88GQ52_NAELO|nr:uncharacterized protein C9374_004446 [Naegleria lovaniensis]KAG2383109.1 hypothetical protein C9374_004446 [Naegleria lovaniensis]
MGNKTSFNSNNKNTTTSEVIHRLDASNEWTLTDQLSGVFYGHEYSLDYYVGFEKSKKARFSQSSNFSSFQQPQQQSRKIILQIQSAPCSRCIVSDAPATTFSECDSSSSRNSENNAAHSTHYTFYVGKDTNEVLCVSAPNNNNSPHGHSTSTTPQITSSWSHYPVDAHVYSKLIEHVSRSTFHLRAVTLNSENSPHSLQKIQLCKYVSSNATNQAEETATFEREDAPSIIGASSFICKYKQRRSGESEVLCEDLQLAFMNFVLRSTEEIFKHEHISER